MKRLTDEGNSAGSTASPKSQLRVSVLCLSALGDVLLALPLMAEIRRVYPGAHVTAVCMRPAAAAMMEEIGVADEVVRLAPNARRSPWALGSSLRQARQIRADIAFQTFSSHGTFGNLILGATRAAIRCGFRDGRFQRFLTHLVPIVGSQHRIILNLNLLRRLGHRDIQPPDGRFLPPFEGQFSTSTGEADPMSRYVLCSAGSDPKLAFKQWPNEKWHHLCKQLVSDGFRVVFVGDASQEETNKEILKGINGAGINLAGKTTFSELASLISSSAAVVATDGMILHLSAALGKNCVGIFGPTHPEIGGPWGGSHEKVWLGLPCSPCYGSLSVGKSGGCPTRECLVHLPMELVYSKLQGLLAREIKEQNSTAETD